VLTVFGAIGVMATASRMLWSFAREDGAPFSRYLSRVERRSALPLYSICATATVSLVLALLTFGSRTAFNAWMSLTVASFYSSYILIASILLYRRLSIQSSAIRWGPFRLGKAGVPITGLSLVYSIISLLFSFWPNVAKVDTRTFNWSSVVFSGVLLLAMSWWVVKARFTYNGPKIEINVHK
jgi:choline transport protein